MCETNAFLERGGGIMHGVISHHVRIPANIATHSGGIMIVIRFFQEEDSSTWGGNHPGNYSTGQVK